MSKTSDANEMIEKTGITPVSHYTSESMAKDLIKLVDLVPGDEVLDPCSGRNKVWYNNFPDCVKSYECEIEDGANFFQWRKQMDWFISNPPFSKGILFLEHAFNFCRKGVAFLGNHNFINSLFLPRRMENYKQLGFAISHIQIVQDKRWFGRYYFIIFRRDYDGPLNLGWTLESYKDGLVADPSVMQDINCLDDELS